MGRGRLSRYHGPYCAPWRVTNGASEMCMTAPSICGDRDEMPTRPCRGCALPPDRREPGACWPTTMRGEIFNQSKNFVVFQGFTTNFILEAPKLRSDLCGSWKRASPDSAFLHLHMALHLATALGGGSMEEAWSFFC